MSSLYLDRLNQSHRPRRHLQPQWVRGMLFLSHSLRGAEVPGFALSATGLGGPDEPAEWDSSSDVGFG